MLGLRRILIAAGLAAALGACGGSEADAPAEPRRPVVEVIAAAPLSAPGAIRASGMVGYKRETDLAFYVPGVIGQIAVDVGDTVRAGQQLARLRLNTVQAEATQASLALETAQRDLARAQALYAEGFVSEARLEDARLAVEQARAARAAAGFSRDTAVLTAPAGGVILRRWAEPAQVAQAGAPVLTIGETNSGVIVRVSVSSAQAARVRMGDAASVSVDGDPVGVRQGRVTRIAAKSDDATGGFQLEISIADETGLRSGMVAQAEIASAATAAQSAAIAIPTLALLDARADQGVVFVVDGEGIARRRPVSTAGVSGEHALITSGLQPGERVISVGAAYVRDGDAVQIATRG